MLKLLVPRRLNSRLRLFPCITTVTVERRIGRVRINARIGVLVVDTQYF